MSAPSQAIAPNPHTNLPNVYIQIANKMGFEKKIIVSQARELKIEILGIENSRPW
jgi:hypothetical protein